LKKLNEISGSRSNIQRLSISQGATMIQSASLPETSLESHQHLTRMQQPLIMGFLGYAKELSKLSEECTASLQVEVKMACHYYLHQIAHMKILYSSQADASTNGTNNPAVASISATGSAASTEANIIVSLSQHLLKLVDEVLSASSVKFVAAIIAPLATLIPRILQRCIMTLLWNTSSMINLYNSNSPTAAASSSTAAANGGGAIDGKTRLLKLVVIAQQSYGMLLEAARFDGASLKQITETGNDAFEHVRRYVSLMDLSLTELKFFISSSLSSQPASATSLTYDRDDYRAIWKYVQQKMSSSAMPMTADNLQNFEDYWKSLGRITAAADKESSGLTPSLSRTSLASSNSHENLAIAGVAVTASAGNNQPPAANPTPKSTRGVPINPFQAFDFRKKG
jgi:hypothetical protein